MKENTNKEKADNFTDGVIDMNLSNLSKIENKNNSINSSCKSLSRFEEQKDMIDLLDNQLNVNQIILFNFLIFIIIHRIKKYILMIIVVFKVIKI